MCNRLCGTCLSYYPEDERPGFGECEITDCLVSECQQSCIDWRNGGPDYEREQKVLRNGN